MANHYQILDIDTDADTPTIKAAYRKLSKRYHPDITGDTKGHFFVMLNDAYETLSDESRRKEYDRTLLNESQGYHEPEPQQEQRPSASRTDNRSGEIPRPNINWSAMDWYKKDYSDIKETITLPKPGKIKGIVGGLGYVVLMVLALSFSVVYGIPRLPMPTVILHIIPLILTVMGFVFWKKFLNYVVGRVAFLTPHVLLAVYALYAGIMPADMDAQLLPAIGAVLITAGAVWSALWGAKWWIYWNNVQSSRGYVPFANKNIRDFVSWGTAGALDDAVDKFGERNVALGAAGEKISAELFEELLRIPGTRIFHGLKFPGSETADVDHAIINGNKIVLVDSKMWAGGDYQWGYDGLIVRSNGSTSVDLHTNFYKAVIGYGFELREASIKGRILIHSNNGGRITVDDTNAPKTGVAFLWDTEMRTAQEFFEETGNWFAEGNPGVINKGLLQALLSRLK